MADIEYKIGDRVVVNDRSKENQGRKGTVRYASGGQYWLKFDDEGATGQHGYFGWWLDPVAEGS